MKIKCLQEPTCGPELSYRKQPRTLCQFSLIFFLSIEGINDKDVSRHRIYDTIFRTILRIITIKMSFDTKCGAQQRRAYAVHSTA
jgi:hypothetical protein